MKSTSPVSRESKIYETLNYKDGNYIHYSVRFHVNVRLRFLWTMA